MRVHIVCFTAAGEALAKKLAAGLPPEYGSASLSSARSTGACSPADVEFHAVQLAAWTREHFCTGNVLVFIGACGIAVRSIAPYVAGKTADAAVLVLDEIGRFVIPLLSGHWGRANEMAVLFARLTGGVPVITTATDVHGLFAVDVFAERNGLAVPDMALAKRFAVLLLQTGHGVAVVPERVDDCVRFVNEPPPELDVRHTVPQKEVPLAVFIVTPYNGESAGVLHLIPRCLSVGIGCRKGKTAEELAAFVMEAFAGWGLAPSAIASFASIDLKKDDGALCSLAARYGVPFKTFSAAELRAVSGAFQPSAFVEAVTGVGNVCERAAMACGAIRLIGAKVARNGITLAVGMQPVELRF